MSEPKTQWIMQIHNEHLTVHEFVHIRAGRTLAQVFEETWFPGNAAHEHVTFEFLGVKYSTLAEAQAVAMATIVERTMQTLAELLP